MTEDHATIAVSSRSQRRGQVMGRLADGRVTILVGDDMLTGYPLDEAGQPTGPLPDQRSGPDSSAESEDLGRDVRIGLAAKIASVLRRRALPANAAAPILGAEPVECAAILGGRGHEISLDRLIGFLLGLGYDIDIVIRAAASDRPGVMSLRNDP